MDRTTPGHTADGTELLSGHSASSAAVTAEAELYLAARLARWLADVAIAAERAPLDEELDDAA